MNIATNYNKNIYLNCISIIKYSVIKSLFKLFKNVTNSFQIHIQKINPDFMDVGSDLEEAQYLLSNFNELITKLKAIKSLITESVLKQESANDLSSLWNEADKQLDLRDKLLKQSIKFHSISRKVIMTKIKNFNLKLKFKKKYF